MIRIVDCPVSCGVKYIGGETYYTKPDKFMADLHTVIERNYAVEAKRKWPSMISDFGGFTQFVMTHNSDKYDIGKAFVEIHKPLANTLRLRVLAIRIHEEVLDLG